jgi:hypothetical protein
MWSAPAIQTIQIHVSFDEGLNWHQVTATGGISQNNPLWGDYLWVVPDTLGYRSFAQFEVSRYQDRGIAGVSGIFVVAAAGAMRMSHPMSRAASYAVTVHGGVVDFGFPPADASRTTVTLHTVQGRRVAVLRPSRDGAQAIRWRAPERLGRAALVAQFVTTAPDGSSRTVSRTFVPGR